MVVMTMMSLGCEQINQRCFEAASWRHQWSRGADTWTAACLRSSSCSPLTATSDGACTLLHRQVQPLHPSVYHNRCNITTVLYWFVCAVADRIIIISIIIIITWYFESGLSSNATTRTTLVRVITSSIRQCCNSSGISMSSNGAGRLSRMSNLNFAQSLDRQSSTCNKTTLCICRLCVRPSVFAGLSLSNRKLEHSKTPYAGFLGNT